MDFQKIANNLKNLGLLLLLGSATGCAGSLAALPFAPSKDVPPSILREGAVYAPTKPAKAQPLLAVVRFPARIENRAEPVMAKAYREQYLNIPKGYEGSSSNKEKNPFDNEAAHQQMLVRSTYFAAEMYEQLKKRLPPNSVALQAMSIDLDDQGYLTLRSPNNLPPAVLYVDFFAYYAPKRAYIALPESFGKYLSSVVSVHTSVEGSPETFGAIAGMKQVPLRVGQRNQAADGNGLRGNLVSFLNDWLAEQCAKQADQNPEKGDDDVVLPSCVNKPDILVENGGINKEKIVRQRPFKPGHYFELPLIEYAMNVEELVEQSKTAGGNLSESPGRKVLGAYAEVIVEALNVLDHGKAVEADQRRYAAMFDPELAVMKDGESLTADKAVRLALIRKFEAMEKEFLTQSDRKFIDTTYKATFGDEIRKTLLSEEEIHAKLVQSQTMEFVAGMLQVGLAFGGGALGSSAMMAGQLVNQITMMMLDRSNTLKEEGSAFDKHFKRVNDDIFQFTVEHVGGKVAHIQTTGLADMRAKMQALYWQMINGELDDDIRPAKPLSVTQSKPAPANLMAPKPAPQKLTQKKN